MIETASVDIGNGYIKGLGKTLWRQPSVIGDARELFEGTLKDDDVQYIGDQHYFIGNLALRQSVIPYFDTGDNKAESWIAKILLQTALGIIAPNEHINLVTGLPVDYFFKQKAEFELMLSGFNSSGSYSIQIGTNKISCRPWIVNKKVVPQPLGSAMNYLLNDDGQIIHAENAKRKILIVDIGFYTLDFLALNNMEIDRNKSKSPDGLGIDTAYSIIQSMLREQTGRAPTRQGLDRYIRSGEYEGLNIISIRQQAFRQLAQQISNEIASLNTKYDRYIVTGGWAAEIAPMLNIPHEYAVVMDGTGNVKGYQKIGVRLWGKSNAACVQAKTAIL